MIPIFVGYDKRESVAYHVFCQSIINHASRPVAITPLSLKSLDTYRETHTDGSNQFIYSRFLVPHLMGYRGWAIFADGDMVCMDDIAKLWALRDERYAVMVVKHDYQTRHQRKYIGTALEAVNEDYPCKNWSSVVLWNCGHPSNFFLTPEHVMSATGSRLHRFSHLMPEEIGNLPKEWNVLAEEDTITFPPKLVHYTLGVPGMKHYRDCDHAHHWHDALADVNAITP